MSPQQTPSGDTLDPGDGVGPIPPAPCPAAGPALALPVVAGILTDADGRVLIAQRAPGGSEAGKWEFAGGKIARFEAAQDALRRELLEELGIRAGAIEAYSLVRWRGPPRALNLHAFRVHDWSGEPRALEHQALAWVRPADLIRYPMPAPDRPIRARLALPPQYLITPEPDPARLDDFVERFARAIDNPALGLVSVRAKSLPPTALAWLAETCLARARAQRPEVIVLIHGAVDLAQALGFDGVHLASRQLCVLKQRPLPESKWVFASCHSLAELRAAEMLLVDAATLSPVHPTPLHPQSKPLGWQRYARAAHASWLPTYALGGVGPADLADARRAGAHGIAGMRALWG